MLQAQERPFRLGVRLDEVERAAIDRAVEASGQTLSDWVRSALVDAASEAREPAQKPVKAPAKVDPFMEAVRRARDAGPKAR